MFATCLNPDNNRLEYNGRPMNTFDICAYANISSWEFQRAFTFFCENSILININSALKDYYYVNPYLMREETRDIDSFRFLTEFFNGKHNVDLTNSDLYFKNGRRRKKVDISKIIKEEMQNIDKEK